MLTVTAPDRSSLNKMFLQAVRKVILTVFTFIYFLLSEQKQPITAPAPPRDWLKHKEADKLDTVAKIADEICSENSTQPCHALETFYPASAGGKHQINDTSPFLMPEPGSDDAFDRTNLLLNLEQMIFEHVPLPPELMDERAKPNSLESSSFVPSKV